VGLRPAQVGDLGVDLLLEGGGHFRNHIVKPVSLEIVDRQDQLPSLGFVLDELLPVLRKEVELALDAQIGLVLGEGGSLLHLVPHELLLLLGEVVVVALQVQVGELLAQRRARG
jgi:hypothetical protein